MKINFTKMHGIGNDFMVIDAINQSVELLPKQIQQLANRSFGVGFDQLLLLEKAKNNETDFYYRIFNADGGEVEQCGNGARCVAQFALEKGIVNKQLITAGTITRNLNLQINDESSVTVNMGKVDKLKDNKQFVFVSIGNPHAVVCVDDINAIDIAAQADEINKDFPDGVNVGFMQVESPDAIALRVFERGVGETLACGSGACAAVVAGQHLNGLAKTVRVKLLGGVLTISYDAGEDQIFMTGPAEFVYEGSVEL